MNRRLIIVVLCALVVAGGASYLVFRLARPAATAAKTLTVARIVVAARDLEIGSLVRDSDINIADWAGLLPKGSTGKKSDLVNRGVVSAIYRGEAVTENRLAGVGSGGGLAATIPAGMRACAVRVNEVVGVAGFVIPGMRVDVLITGVPPGESTGGGSAVKTLLQNIQVLSAGANIDKDKEGKPQQAQVVNLLVDPRQAEILSLAGNETRIQLVLRNPTDTEITKPPGTFTSELFGASGFRPPHAPLSLKVSPVPNSKDRRVDSRPIVSVETVEVLNGATHTVAKFTSAAEHQ